MNKVVIITGASNGMGYAATELFAKEGWQVVAGARRVEKIPTGSNILAVKVDVTDSEQNKHLVNQAIEKFGRIDVLINNAGYGEFGPTEEITIDKAKYQFDVNYFAAVDLANQVLPTMRQQKAGVIVNISSIGGDLYMPLGAHYHASKAALQQWSDVLDTEIRQFGVHSIVIQPGGTASAWAQIAMDNAKKNLHDNSPYKTLVTAVSNLLTGNRMTGATSEQLAQLFYLAANASNPKRRYFHAGGDHLAVWVARNHPKTFKFALDKFVGRLIKR